MNGKKGLLAATIALVAVVALGSVAYGALAPKGSTTNAQATGDQVQAESATSEAVNSDTNTADVEGQSQSDTAEATPLDIELPDFAVYDTEGTQVTLSSMNDKPVLVGFWASWCPPCRAEAPAIQELYERFGDQVNFMMINATDGQQETVDSATAWYNEQGLSYPIYLDTSGEAVAAGQVMYLPTTYLLDAQGNVVFAESGALDAERGAALVASVL